MQDFDDRWDGASIPSEHWHFHRRLLQRYGVVLGPGEYSGIVRALRKKEAIVVEARGKGLAIYRVRLNISRERVYVLAKGQQILSAFPPQRFRRRRTPEVKKGYLDIPGKPSIQVFFRVLKS
ncbi:hypothetical protein ACVILK_000355 [Bradyrhizobium embrapense]